WDRPDAEAAAWWPTERKYSPAPWRLQGGGLRSCHRALREKAKLRAYRARDSVPESTSISPKDPSLSDSLGVAGGSTCPCIAWHTDRAARPYGRRDRRCPSDGDRGWTQIFFWPLNARCDQWPGRESMK